MSLFSTWGYTNKLETTGLHLELSKVTFFLNQGSPGYCEDEFNSTLIDDENATVVNSDNWGFCSRNCNGNVAQVSLSSTFYAHVFRMKVLFLQKRN